MPRLALVLVLALGACDAASSDGPPAAVFSGARHTVAGPDVVLDVAGGLLRMDAPLGGRLDVETRGVREVDFYFDASGLGDGETFATETIGPDGRARTRLSQTRDGDAYRVRASWAEAGPAVVEAVYRGRVVYTAPLGASGAEAGSTDRPATSMHRDKNNKIIWDYEGGSTDGGGSTGYRPDSTSAETYRVTHLRVVPPSAAGAAGAVRFTLPAGGRLVVYRERFR